MTKCASDCERKDDVENSAFFSYYRGKLYHLGCAWDVRMKNLRMEGWNIDTGYVRGYVRNKDGHKLSVIELFQQDQYHIEVISEVVNLT